MSIELTNSAKARIDQICLKENASVRLQILAGGCSGFNKVWIIEKNIPFYDDIIINTNTGVLLIDHMSAEIIDNSTIDYIDSINGSNFVIDIPHAKNSCGCGSSFNI